MARKCSHCGNKGHNCRTCSNPRILIGDVRLKLFGVHLSIPCCPIRKSFSMDCLASSSYLPSSSSSSPSSSATSLVSIDKNTDKVCSGYLSDDHIGRAQERKKGVPWTEEEHRTFLSGLEKLGKGDWRGISRNFVTTRTPTQVASHAQKYFLRQNSLNKKRRSSLFDMVGNCKRAVHVPDDISRSKDSPSPGDLQFPALSLNMTANEVDDKTGIDINVPEQVSQLPSHLHRASVDDLYPSIGPQPVPLIEKPHFHLPSLDLELSISSSSSLSDQNKPNPRSLIMGTIQVI